MWLTATTPACSSSKYFRRTITIPMLVHLLVEFNTRSSEDSSPWYLLGDITEQSLATVSNKVTEWYEVDRTDVSALKSEIHSWLTRWESEERDHGCAALPSSLATTFPKISGFYTNIKAVLCTLPVTFCSTERLFSGLKHMKSSLRSSMTNERLSSLALLHMHQDIPVNFKEIIEVGVILGTFSCETSFFSLLLCVHLAQTHTHTHTQLDVAITACDLTRNTCTQ